VADEAVLDKVLKKSPLITLGGFLLMNEEMYTELCKSTVISFFITKLPIARTSQHSQRKVKYRESAFIIIHAIHIMLK